MEVLKESNLLILCFSSIRNIFKGLDKFIFFKISVVKNISILKIETVKDINFCPKTSKCVFRAM